MLAVDRLADLGGTLAGISPETMKKLDAALPPIWSRANPVDIAGDADAARYTAALESLLEDPENDAILGHECSDRARFGRGRGKIGRPRSRKRIAAIDPAEADLCGVGRRAVMRPRQSSKRPAFPIMRPKPTRSAASCISYATGKRTKP